MNKRKLERQYQRVLKKNEALKGALINCALQLKITLIRHGEDMSLGQNQWYSDFIEFAEEHVGHKLPTVTVVSFNGDEILEQGEVVHQRFEEYFNLRGSSTGRLTTENPITEQILMKTDAHITYMPKLQVWHIPQLPMKAFKVDVANVTEALKIMETLALYDDFEYTNNVKGNYCNVQGLNILYPELTGDDAEVAWDIEFKYKGNYEYFDTPAEFMYWLNQQGMTEEQFLKEVPTAHDCYVEWINSSLEEG